MTEALFYLLSGAMLFFGLCAVCSRSPLHAALFLVLSFLCVGGLFVLAGAFFLGAAQVLLYAGAIVVLFVFVIMLLSEGEERQKRLSWFGALGALLVGGLLAWELAVIVGCGAPASAPAAAAAGTAGGIGRLLFSTYLLPFEVTSVLLLAAVIGAVALAQKEEGR